MSTTQNIPAVQTQQLFLPGFPGKGLDLHGFADQAANQQHGFLFADICEKSVIPDFLQTVRQDMEEKTANEFQGGKGHFLGCVIVASILVGEGYPSVGNGFDPVIADGDPMGVATRKRNESLLGTHCFQSKEWKGVKSTLGFSIQNRPKKPKADLTPFALSGTKAYVLFFIEATKRQARLVRDQSQGPFNGLGR
jgi:hypothetical protein